MPYEDERVVDSIRKRPSMYVGGTDLWGYVVLMDGLIRTLVGLGGRDIRWSREGDADVLTSDGPAPDFESIAEWTNAELGAADPDSPSCDWIDRLCPIALTSELDCTRSDTGCVVRLKADRSVFSQTELNGEAVRSYFRRQSHLRPGVAFTADHGGPPTTFRSTGLIDMLREMSAPLQLLHAPIAGRSESPDATVAAAFAFHSAPGDFIASFAFYGLTPGGGSHEDGLTQAVNAIRGRYGIAASVGVTAVLHVESADDLRFAGCVRDRVETPTLTGQVEDAVLSFADDAAMRNPNLPDDLSGLSPFRFR